MPTATEQLQVVELAREFAREKIEPYAAEWDRTKHFPRDVIDEMGKLGFLGMCAPEEYDGMGLDALTYVMALEEIAAADAAIAVSMGIHNAIPTTMLVKHGTPTQKDRWLRPMARGELLAGFALSEADAGSDPASLRAQAVRDGGGWVLNGAKAWASNAGTADLMMIMVRTDTRRRGAVRRGSRPSSCRPTRRAIAPENPRTRWDCGRRIRRRSRSRTCACRPRRCWARQGWGSCTRWKASTPGGSGSERRRWGSRGGPWSTA